MSIVRSRLVDSLHYGNDPFIGFDRMDMAREPVQWDSYHKWFVEAIEDKHPSVVIEVGSFAGASAIHMATFMREKRMDSCLICIDTWLGDRQLWTRIEHREALQFKFGRPEIYLAFLANVIAAGVSDYILPIPMHSTGGARYLAKRGVTASVIYIDGSHDEGDVYADLTLYWELLEPKGIMLIDDYVPDTNNNEMFWGLIQDVDRFVKQRSLKLERNGRKARIRKTG